MTTEACIQVDVIDPIANPTAPPVSTTSSHGGIGINWVVVLLSVIGGLFLLGLVVSFIIVTTRRRPSRRPIVQPIPAIPPPNVAGRGGCFQMLPPIVVTCDDCC